MPRYRTGDNSFFQSQSDIANCNGEYFSPVCASRCLLVSATIQGIVPGFNNMNGNRVGYLYLYDFALPPTGVTMVNGDTPVLKTYAQILNNQKPVLSPILFTSGVSISINPQKPLEFENGIFLVSSKVSGLVPTWQDGDDATALPAWVPWYNATVMYENPSPMNSYSSRC
jgi:hypothetical protein